MAAKADEGAAAASAVTHTTVLRHIGRTSGSECVDLLYRWTRATYLPGDDDDEKDGMAGSDGAVPLVPLSSSVRSRIAKACPADVAAGLSAAADAAATAPDSGAMQAGVERAAAEVGLRFSSPILTSGAAKKDKKSQEAAKEANKAAVAEVRVRSRHSTPMSTFVWQGVPHFCLLPLNLLPGPHPPPLRARGRVFPGRGAGALGPAALHARDGPGGDAAWQGLVGRHCLVEGAGGPRG